MSGYLVARAGFLSINAAVAWLPWVILGTHKILDKDNKEKSIPILGLIFGFQFLAGHAQTTWYTIILSLLWAIFLSWGKNNRNLPGVNSESYYPAKSRNSSIYINLKWVFHWGLSVLLGIGLSAVQLFITAEYLVQSQRAVAVDYEFAMTYSFWPWRLLGFIAPDIFGNPVYGDYWGYANFWEDAIYVGLLPFLFAISVLIKAFWRRGAQHKGFDRSNDEMKTSSAYNTMGISRKNLVKFLGLIILMSFIFAFGQNTPVYPWLYHNVPTFDMFQAPTRFTLWAEFAFPLLAAIGVDQWRRPEGRGLYWTRLGTMAAFAVTLGAGLAWVLIGDIRPTFIRATTITGFWGLGIGFLTLFAPREEARPNEYDSGKSGDISIWAVAVVIWVIADLLYAGWGLNPGVDLNFYQQPPSNIHELTRIMGSGRLYLPLDDEYEIKYNQFFRFSTFSLSRDWRAMRNVYLPNLNMLNEVSSVNNFDPLVPGRYTNWMDVLADPNTMNTNQMMNLMDIWVVENLDLDQENEVKFYPREGAKRLWWVPCARYMDGEEEVLNLITAGDVDLESELILESQPSVVSNECRVIDDLSNLQVLEKNPNYLVVDVTTKTSGWLVWSEVWYPGWKAWVNGENVDIQRADYLFRAVEIPAGQNLVVFSYRPTWFYVGVLVSIPIWLVLFGFLLTKRR
jgi:hypothetical protein